MLWNTKSLKASYNDELKKQTDPYGYYLKHNTDKINKADKGEHENVPSICMDKIAKISEDDKASVYEYGDYLLYESKKGYSSNEERVELLTFAEKLNADLIYSDIDHVDSNGKKHTPFYKPDYFEDTFRSFDLYSDFYAVKKDKSRSDISLLENVAHVTKVLFHYNCEENQDEINRIHGLDNINNIGYLTDDMYYENWCNSNEKDKISIIIPSKDNPQLIETCLTGIKNAKIKSKINTLEVVIVDNGSLICNKEKITAIIERISSADEGLSINYIYKPEEFNFSSMCNTGAETSKGDYLLFLNDDIEITDSLFLLKMLHFASMDHIGAVGCKLLYPGDEKKIQHTGITCLRYAGPSHKLSTFLDDRAHYFGKNIRIHNYLAVTGACLMVSREKYFKTGGFCDKMKVGYNDVDLCVSLYEKGYLNVVNNDCVLIHHESVTRGSDHKSEAKLVRLDKERKMLYDRHPWIMEKGDPFYNPNLAEDFLDYRVNVIPDFEKRDYISKECGDMAFMAAPVFKDHLAFIDGEKSTDGEDKPSDALVAQYGKNIYANIEKTVKNRDFYDISGWALVNKKHNNLFETYFVVIGGSKDESADNIVKLDGNEKALKRYLVKGASNSQVRVYDTAKVFREDLKAVFPEAKESELSGFFARIPSSLIEKEGISFGVLLVNKQSGKKYYAGYNKSDI